MIKDCIMIEPLFVEESESVIEAAKVLRKHLIRYVYVVDKAHKPVGVISLSDINNRIVAEGKNPAELTAKDIMTKELTSFEENIPASDAYRACMKNHVATCPVTNNGKLVGIVTVQELLKRMTQVE